MSLLKGEKVFLRALEPEDASVIYAWENNPEIWHLSNTLTPFSLHTIKKYIDSIQDIYADKQLRLMICLNNTNKPVGTIDLFDFDANNSRCGLGILIAEKSDRNKGYAKEALHLVIDYTFNVLFLNQLYCNIIKGNKFSIHLFSSAGFVLCGTKKAWIKSGKKYEDELMYQLLKK
jgi:diamine N-acetyltransferase